MKVPWRLLATLLVFALLAVLVGRNLGDLAQLERTLRRGNPLWLGAALLLQLAGLANGGALTWALYRLVGLPASYRRILPLSLASQFVNFTTPTSGLGGTAVFVRDARSRGLETGRVVVVGALFSLFNLLWFSVLLVLGLALLFLRHDLRTYELVAAALLLGGTLLLAGALGMAGARPRRLERTGLALAALLARVTRPLVGRTLLRPERVTAWVGEFAAAAATLRRPDRHLAPAVLFTVLTDLLELAVLFACLRAFLASPSGLTPGVLVAGYAVGVLFSSVAVTPQGLGVVEGALGATLVSLGLPLAEVALGVLAYRGFSYWLPLLAGAVAMRTSLADPKGVDADAG